MENSINEVVELCNIKVLDNATADIKRPCVIAQMLLCLSDDIDKNMARSTGRKV